MSVETQELRSYPQVRGGCPLHPPKEYAGWRKEDNGISRVTLWDGRTAWVITGLEHAQVLLKDPRLCADRMHPNYPSEGPAHAVKGPTRRAFRAMDGEQHSYYRRLLARDFALRTINAMRPRMRAIIDDLITAMKQKGAPADLFTDFALPLPLKVTCDLLGVPVEDQSTFDRWINEMLGSNGDPQIAETAGQNLSRYLLDLIDRKSTAPQDDLMSRLASGPLATGEITRDDALVTAMILLLGGYESTASSIASGILALMQNPEQLARVRAGLEPDQVARMVEELLRFTSVTDVGANRFALERIEFGGKVIEAGDGIIFHFPSINRDESVYPDPDALDIDRRTNPHQAFGFGPHQCVGQNLARAEIQEAVPAILSALPNLRLAVPEDALRYREHMLVVGVASLPVTWDE